MPISNQKDPQQGPKHSHIFWAALVAILALLPVMDAAWRTNAVGILPLDVLIRHSRDDYIFSYHQIANIPDQSEPVVIFGGSGMREAIVSRPELTALFKEKNPDYHATITASLFRTLADDLALLERLPDGPGVIVYGSTFSRFGWDNDMLDRFLSGKASIAPAGIVYEQNFDNPISQPTGIIESIRRWIRANTYLTNGAIYIADRLRAQFRGKKREYNIHRQQIRQRKDFSHREKQLSNWLKKRTIDGKPARLDQFMGWFDNFLSLAKSKNYQVVVVDQPLDLETIDGRLDSVIQSYSQAMRNLTEQYGVDYIDVLSLPPFDPNDFRDLAHLKKDLPRLSYTNALLKHIPKNVNVK